MTAPVIKMGGVPHYTVGTAARLMRTTPARVRGLMGDGTLEWNQGRINGPIVVTVESVRRYLRARDAPGQSANA